MSSTPLPLAQIAALFSCKVAEGAVWFVIMPYINALFLEAGIPEHKVGLYSAAAESLFMLFECFTAILAAGLSDKLGRKPVLLIGLALYGTFGIIVGFSKSVFWIITLRCLQGGFAGPGGVVSRTILVEITDKTNIVRAYSLLSPGIILGMSFGGWVGGHMSHPAENIQAFKESTFFKNHPYVLPNLIIAIFSWIATSYGWIVLRETRKSHGSLEQGKEKPPSIGYWELLTEPKVTALIFYLSCQQLLSLAGEVMIPLVAYTDVSLGGWGLSIPTIGTITSLSAMTGLLTNLLVLPWMTTKISRSNCMRLTIWLTPLFYSIFPIIVFFAEGRARGDPLPSCLFWLMLAVQTVIKRLGDMESTIVDTLVPSAIPRPEGLSVMNGMIITWGGFGRAIGPFISNGLFGYSEGGKPGSWRREVSWIGMFLTASIPGILAMRRLPFAEIKEQPTQPAEEYELLRNGSVDELDGDLADEDKETLA